MICKKKLSVYKFSFKKKLLVLKYCNKTKNKNKNKNNAIIFLIYRLVKMKFKVFKLYKGLHVYVV